MFPRIFFPCEADSCTAPQLLSTFARRGNFGYGTAVNGLEAVQAFEAAEKPYDIIIMGRYSLFPSRKNTNESIPTSCCLDSTRTLLISPADITMPVMNGTEATREIRKLERAARPQRARAMVIALTGLGSATSRKEAFDSGVDMFVTKPASLKDLRRILEDWERDALKRGGGGGGG